MDCSDWQKAHFHSWWLQFSGQAAWHNMMVTSATLWTARQPEANGTKSSVCLSICRSKKESLIFHTWVDGENYRREISHRHTVMVAEIPIRRLRCWLHGVPVGLISKVERRGETEIISCPAWKLCLIKAWKCMLQAKLISQFWSFWTCFKKDEVSFIPVVTRSALVVQLSLLPRPNFSAQFNRSKVSLEQSFFSLSRPPRQCCRHFQGGSLLLHEKILPPLSETIHLWDIPTLFSTSCSQGMSLYRRALRGIGRSLIPIICDLDKNGHWQ